MVHRSHVSSRLSGSSGESGGLRSRHRDHSISTHPSCFVQRLRQVCTCHIIWFSMLVGIVTTCRSVHVWVSWNSFNILLCSSRKKNVSSVVKKWNFWHHLRKISRWTWCSVEICSRHRIPRSGIIAGSIFWASPISRHVASIGVRLFVRCTYFD